jgi:hypothetical protein
MIAFLIAALFGLYLHVPACLAFDFTTFENANFPFYISIDLAGTGVVQTSPTVRYPITKVKFTAGDYFETIDQFCSAGHYTEEGCNEVMRMIGTHIHNPRGVVFDRFVHDYSSYMPQVLEAERANNAFSCLELSGDGSSSDSGGVAAPSCLLATDPASSGAERHEAALLRIRGMFAELSVTQLLAMRDVAFIHRYGCCKCSTFVDSLRPSSSVVFSVCVPVVPVVACRLVVRHGFWRRFSASSKTLVCWRL